MARRKRREARESVEEERPRSDRGLGIETSRTVGLESLGLSGPTAAHAQRYEPTPFHVLDDMLLGLDLDYESLTFVDLGCGKGRVLCLASRWPFRKIIGVELSSRLHAIAAENLRALRAPWQRCHDLKVLLADAATYVLPNEPTVLFMFNPFSAPIVARVVENVERSLVDHPRPFYVLYYMPVHEEVIRRSRQLVVRSTARDWIIFERASVADAAE